MRTFYVPDMSCQHCVKRIEGALLEAHFSDFKIDLEAKKVMVDVSSEEIEKVLSVIEEAGYSPKEATI
ncbi:MAG: heavy-metal-associated domain-containing protein [Synergistaceae bacterium]|nr:heavy-metal-associated domain-containing protein [Synergistaceae bacterium]